MAERVADLAVERVVAAVADEHALAVADVAVLAGEVEVGRGVLQPQRERLGEPPARVRGAEQQVGDGAAARPGRPASTRARPRRAAPSPDSRTAEPLASTTTRRGFACGEPREQRGLVGGQVDVRCGRSPRTRPRAGSPRKRDHGRCARAASATASAAQRARRRRSSSSRSPAANATSTPSGTAARSSSSGDVDPGRVDLRAAGALVARRAGELADDGDRLARRAAAAAAARRRSSAAPRTRRGGRAGQRVVRVARRPSVGSVPCPGAVDQLRARARRPCRARASSSAPVRDRGDDRARR